jgi:head-tail adaptor
MLDAAIRDRNDKAWNRAAAELAEAEFMLTIATADVAEA